MSKRAFETAFSSSPAGAIVAAAGWDAPRVAPTTVSPLSLPVPGQWPVEVAAAPPEEAYGLFATLGRWAAAAFGRLQGRPVGQVPGPECPIAVTIPNSHKKRVMDASAVWQARTRAPPATTPTPTTPSSPPQSRPAQLLKLQLRSPQRTAERDADSPPPRADTLPAPVADSPPPRRRVRWASQTTTKVFFDDQKTTQLHEDVFAKIGELLAAGRNNIELPADDAIVESQMSAELLEDLQDDLKKKMSLAPPPKPKLLIEPLYTKDMRYLDDVAQATEWGEKTSADPVDKKLSVADFGTLLPDYFNGNPKAWLNDNIVNEYLDILIKDKQSDRGYQHTRGGEAPPYHAFSSFWYNTMRTRPKNVLRWTTRVELSGKKFLDAELLLYPICDGGHWRLLAVKPKERTIEYFDSLGYNGKPYIERAVKNIEMELKDAYVADEWTIVQKQRSSQQLNGSDCGVFTLLNALALLRGEEPDRVIASEGMKDARERIAFTLLCQVSTGELA